MQIPKIGTLSNNVAFVNETGIKGSLFFNLSNITTFSGLNGMQAANLSVFFNSKVSLITGDKTFITGFGLDYSKPKYRYFGYSEIVAGIQVGMFQFFVSKQWLFAQDFVDLSKVSNNYKPSVVNVGTTILFSAFQN